MPSSSSSAVRLDCIGVLSFDLIPLLALLSLLALLLMLLLLILRLSDCASRFIRALEMLFGLAMSLRRHYMQCFALELAGCRDSGDWDRRRRLGPQWDFRHRHKTRLQI
jgi:hypothetical protein